MSDNDTCQYDVLIFWTDHLSCQGVVRQVQLLQLCEVPQIWVYSALQIISGHGQVCETRRKARHDSTEVVVTQREDLHVFVLRQVRYLSSEHVRCIFDAVQWRSWVGREHKWTRKVITGKGDKLQLW